MTASKAVAAPAPGVGSLSRSYPISAGCPAKRSATAAHIAASRVWMPTPSGPGASAQNASYASWTAGEER